MATLKDIANELNVSVALVSKVLNNSKSTTGASVKTAEAIRQTAARMGYTRNRTALSLRTGRHNTIAVLVHGPGTPGSNLTEMLLNGIAECAQKHEQRLELTFYKTDEAFRNAISAVRDSLTDGLLVGGIAHPDVVQDLLDIKNSGMQVVTACSVDVHPDIPNVKVDGIAIGKMATDHLIDRGCRRIAHLNIWNDCHIGYCKALEQAGIEYDPALIYTTQFVNKVNFSDGKLAINHWLEKGVEYDSIFAPSDFHAMSLLKALFKAGISVPEDVKVVGIDNSPADEFGVVSLSSISANDRLCGSIAVDMLMNLLNDKHIESVEIEPILFARESTM